MMKGIKIGEGSKVYTVIYKHTNTSELMRCTAYGSHPNTWEAIGRRRAPPHNQHTH